MFNGIYIYINSASFFLTPRVTLNKFKAKKKKNNIKKLK